MHHLPQTAQSTASYASGLPWSARLQYSSSRSVKSPGCSPPLLSIYSYTYQDSSRRPCNNCHDFSLPSVLNSKTRKWFLKAAPLILRSTTSDENSQCSVHHGHSSLRCHVSRSSPLSFLPTQSSHIQAGEAITFILTVLSAE